MSDEIEAVRGYLFTEVDCPHCGRDNRFEGHVTQEWVVCQGCEEEFNIGETM